MVSGNSPYEDEKAHRTLTKTRASAFPAVLATYEVR
jgi:hypothetical protein